MKSTLVRLLNSLTVQDKGTIRQKIRRLFFLLSITTLVLSGVVAMSGVLTTQSRMEDMGEHLGESARDSVTELVSEREKEHLEQIVHEKVVLMDAAMIDSVAGDVKILAENMEDILAAPQNYLPKELIRSQSLEDGWALSLTLTPTGVDNLDNLRGRISMAANIQNNLKNIALSYYVDCSAYAVFEDGFGFIVDTGEEDMRADYFDNPLDYMPFNFVERPWYKNTKEKNDVVITDTMLNATADNSDPIVVCSAPIIMNDEFIGVTGLGFFVKDVARFYFETAIGKTGFWIMMNRNGQVIVSTKSDGDLSVKDGFPDVRSSEEQSLALAAEKMVRGEKDSMLVTVDGEEYFLAFESLQSVEWSFGALIKVSEVTAPADAVALTIDRQTNEFVKKTGHFAFNLFVTMAIAFVVLLAAVSVLSERLTKSFSEPIQRLSDGVREIAGGNFDKKIEDVKTGDELEHLAVSFNAMTDELKRYMTNLEAETAARERISTELNVATNIQLSALPHDFDLGRKDVEIFATMHAAKEVGGDFYDFYLLDENHLVITIADVSGKGVPAALFMMQAKTILRNLAMTMKDPDDLGAVMTLANQQLCQGNDEMMFVTVFMGMLDLNTGRFIYVNGGHNPPLVYHNSHFEYLAMEKNCVLGMMEDMDYVQQEIQLDNGDIVYLYTDGVTEAMDEENNQYGEERLLKFLNDAECLVYKLPKLLELVKGDLSEHVGAAEQSDDITMLAVKFIKGKFTLPEKKL